MRAVAWAPLPLCASGTAGGECGDSLTDAQCGRQHVEVSHGTIAASLCGCFDWQPTCSQARPAAHAGPRPSRDLRWGTLELPGRDGVLRRLCLRALRRRGSRKRRRLSLKGRTGLANRPIPRSCPSRSQGNTSFGLGVDHLPRPLDGSARPSARSTYACDALDPGARSVTVTPWR